MQLRIAHDLPSRLQPVEHGHADIHQHHIRPPCGHERHSLLTIGRFADDLELAGSLEQHSEPGPHQRLVGTMRRTS